MLQAFALCLTAASCAPTTSPQPSIVATPSAQASQVAATVEPTPEPTVAIDVACNPELGGVAPALRGDPCPGAITAVELAVAPVRLPIARIVVEPGPFYCDVLWPGVQSPATCYGVLVLAGQFMHARVSFERSDQIAVVMLGRDLPHNLQVPASKPIAWNATLVTVEAPPDGWTMP